MKRLLLTALFTFSLALLLVQPVFAQSPSPSPQLAESAVRLPQFLSGDMITVSEDASGAVFAAGRQIEIDADVAGDVVAAGSTLIIRGTVTEDVYAAAGTIIIDGRIEGILTAAAGTIEVTENGYVQDAAILAGGKVRSAGEVEGSSWIAAEKAELFGKLGAVTLMTEKYSIGEQAQIAQLTGQSQELSSIPSSASIAGVVSLTEKERSQHDEPAGVVGYLLTVLWKSVTLGIFYAAFMWLFPKFIAKKSAALRSQALPVFVAGVAWVMLIPLFALLTFVTVLAWQVGIVALFAWLLTIFLAPLIVIGSAHDRLRQWLPSLPAACLAVALFAAATSLSFFGAFLSFLVAVFGSGAVVRSLWLARFPDVRQAPARKKRSR